MPELPEVETTVRGLSVILNQIISNVKIHTSKLRFKIPNNIINILRNSKISNLRRIAKFIIIDLDTNYSLIIHLGMSGRLKTIDKSYKRIKHDHFVLYFSSKRKLVYHDPRKFGFIDIFFCLSLLFCWRFCLSFWFLQSNIICAVRSRLKASTPKLNIYFCFCRSFVCTISINPNFLGSL